MTNDKAESEIIEALVLFFIGNSITLIAAFLLAWALRRLLWLDYSVTRLALAFWLTKMYFYLTIKRR